MQGNDSGGGIGKTISGRRTVDYYAPLLKYMRSTILQPQSQRNAPFLCTGDSFLDLLIPGAYSNQPQLSFTTKLAMYFASKITLSPQGFGQAQYSYQIQRPSSINSIIWLPGGRSFLAATYRGEFLICHTSNPQIPQTGKHQNQGQRSQDENSKDMGAQEGLVQLYQDLCVPLSADLNIQGNEGAIRCLKMSKNQTYFLAGDEKGNIKYWEFPKNSRERKYMGRWEQKCHQAVVRCMDFSPNGAKMCSVSDDQTVRIWDMNNHASLITEEKVLVGHGGDVKSCAWHPCLGLVASGGKDQVVKLWDPRQGKNIGTLHNFMGPITDIKFNQNQNWVLVACRNNVSKVIDLRSQLDIQTFKGHTKDVMCCQWHPTNQQVCVTGGRDGQLMHWVVDKSTPQAVVPRAHFNLNQDAQNPSNVQGQQDNQEQETIFSMEFNPLGHLLATGSFGGLIGLWCRPRPGSFFPNTLFDNENNKQQTTTNQERLKKQKQDHSFQPTNMRQQSSKIVKILGSSSRGQLPGFEQGLLQQ